MDGWMDRGWWGWGDWSREHWLHWELTGEQMTYVHEPSWGPRDADMRLYWTHSQAHTQWYGSLGGCKCPENSPPPHDWVHQAHESPLDSPVRLPLLPILPSSHCSTACNRKIPCHSLHNTLLIWRNPHKGRRLHVGSTYLLLGLKQSLLIN